MTQRIENSDRGITMNKGLAWSMACGMIGAGLWVGIQLASATTKIDEFARINTDAASARASLEVRVRALENAATQTRVQFETLYQTMQEIKTDQRESNDLLRRILNERLNP
ncbi:hypothetical protein [Pseudosulfitobacter pseudonitzschiae]|uniref:hypothetical protein n=1 Tax=Pseudosulfitobacter pseudonitzschiae TaxID=1402135 RepID=UPI001AF393C1|nr:hypothetical protein [Pseudosulfitobacter pseudonitzschiae]MBM1817154.1 hypothetical protein [Pseudosulfitobacter pseudonitzschiae]MBM1834157.1 hypothetical protein [Pseudosulfitobacter pseudonitzschiae]MBM1839022.1 hypothetical protein [Pseudosulfitobacter pseudonitzschiae]MBM1843872.1 hypothetical protein [Pseudosulfitobacter pseudonitzschiae]MBM1848718.1 hypothetical protein [Pseudosulfitobacter pseudonitzschiae]